jgi:hypothetical protein
LRKLPNIYLLPLLFRELTTLVWLRRYTIAPPATAVDKPFPHTLCETVCPFSDGLIYESDSGENFRMSCSKRHGTTILWTQPAETFDECMDICGKILVRFLALLLRFSSISRYIYIPPGPKAPSFIDNLL